MLGENLCHTSSSALAEKRAEGIVSFGRNIRGMCRLAVPVINALVLGSLCECRQCKGLVIYRT